MLRLLIVTGLLLMAGGFGAAGFQYWQGQTGASQSVDDAMAGQSAAQTWLTSSSGGLVPRDDARAYLIQDRLVRERTVVVTRTAHLTDLLLDGEKLPDPAYFEVLADIRAPRLAETLCPLVTDVFAGNCQVNEARVVAGSVNPVQGTAQFTIELVFRPAPEGDPLPDLAAHVLHIREIALDLSQDPEASVTTEAALAAALRGSQTTCEEQGLIACRVLGVTLDWAQGQTAQAVLRVAGLAPLPDGMFPAPPLETPPPEG
ncbi:MAG: hypothetical protein MUE52_12820 [Tabrizicola sp.]|jgi:hypothetical protein|nr:hypothetical protein [Tabrizicola sp.]